MESLLQFWENQWNAYPEWLVGTSVAIVAVVGLWIVAKFFAWLLKWILVAIAFIVLIGGLVYWLG